MGLDIYTYVILGKELGDISEEKIPVKRYHRVTGQPYTDTVRARVMTVSGTKYCVDTDDELDLPGIYDLLDDVDDAGGISSWVGPYEDSVVIGVDVEPSGHREYLININEVEITPEQIARAKEILATVGIHDEPRLYVVVHLSY